MAKLNIPVEYKMPGQTRKARKYSSRRTTRKAGKKTGYRRKPVNKYKLKKGYLRVMRKMNEITISSTGTAGTLFKTEVLPSGSLNCLNVNNINTIAQGLSGGVAYDVPFSLQFALNQVINHQELTNLADKYRIAGAYVRIYYNHSGASGASTYSQPYVQYTTDGDDATVPTLSSLREKMGVKMKTFKNQSAYIGIKCKPVPNRQVYNPGGTAAYEVAKYAPYLDCANDGVPHFGIKGVISNMNLPATAGIECMKFDVALLLELKDIQ